MAAVQPTHVAFPCLLKARVALHFILRHMLWLMAALSWPGRYSCTSKWAKVRATSKVAIPACVPPTSYGNGSALVFYNSTSYRDDLLWAAAWMYKATGERVRTVLSTYLCWWCWLSGSKCHPAGAFFLVNNGREDEDSVAKTCG